jgi:general stress protein 26
MQQEPHMTTTDDLENKFWEALESDKTVMLGIDGVEDGHTRPMTAQIAEHKAPLWFFTTKDNALVKKLGTDSRAVATFASKGHDLFATLQGSLRVETSRAVVDSLWSESVAAWYPQGKEDPTLALLKFDAQRAEIWRRESSAFTGLRLLFGGAPKKERIGDVAEIRLS